MGDFAIADSVDAALPKALSTRLRRPEALTLSHGAQWKVAHDSGCNVLVVSMNRERENGRLQA